MIKKIIFIIFVISAYIFIVSSDPKGEILISAKNFCNECYAKYKKMNLKYHVNKWPKKDKKNFY